MSSTLKRKGRQKGKWKGLYSNEEELKELQRQHGKETSKKWAKEWAKMRMSRPPTEKEIAIRKKLAERMRKFNKDPKMRKKQVDGLMETLAKRPPKEKKVRTPEEIEAIRKAKAERLIKYNTDPEMRKKQIAGWVNNPSEKMLEARRKNAEAARQRQLNKTLEEWRTHGTKVSKTMSASLDPNRVNIIFLHLEIGIEVSSWTKVVDFIDIIKKLKPETTIDDVLIAYGCRPMTPHESKSHRANKIAKLRTKLERYWYEINPPQ